MRTVIISGSPDADLELIKQTVRSDDLVICADLGLRHALDAGVHIDLAVGDLDSFEGELPCGLPVIRLRRDKDFSDTHEAARLALDRGADEIVVLCALGARLDHAFSNLSTLAQLATLGVNARIISASETVYILDRGEHRFDDLCGRTFSVFAFGCETAVLSYTGARYPLDRGVLKATEPMGLSNVFEEPHACITVHSGTVMAVVNAF